MKKLKRVLLINWHYIKRQVINFEDISFLTGKNKVGKSTIIDAMQLLMLGETKGYYFNKAANESSKRDLKGYLRCQVGDVSESGFKYLRGEDYGNFACYIAAEFYDDVKGTNFIVGIVFDCFDDGSHKHSFFILDIQFPEDIFIKDGIPMDSKTFKEYLYNTYKIEKPFCRSNEEYQKNILSKFGGLNKEYFGVFLKPVALKFDMDIEKFISDYVCEVKHRIEISNMQESIRHYKQLEQEVNIVSRRIELLKKIEINYTEYLKAAKRLYEHNYIIDRADKQYAIEKIADLIKEVEVDKLKLDNVNKIIVDKKEEYWLLDNKKKDLLKERFDVGYDRLNEKLNDCSEKIKYLEGKQKKLVDKFNVYGISWAQGLSEIFDIFDADFTLNKDDILSEYTSLINKAEWLKKISNEDLENIEESYLIVIASEMNTFLDYTRMAHANITMLINSTEAGILKISKEVENLKKGINNYSQQLTELKKNIEERLTNKYGRPIEIHILCELLEIKDMKWQNAIEAYLNNQKFYFIIEPEYFIEALKIYDELKFMNKYYDIGIVDSGRLMGIDIKMETGSLAEVVHTNNIHGRRFIDFILGRVTRCERVEDLRNYRTAITPTCMLYQNFVARQLNPERWRYPYIGKKAREQQIEMKGNELNNLNIKLIEQKDLTEKYKRLKNLHGISNNDISAIIEDIEEVGKLTDWKENMNNILKALEKIGLDYIGNIETEIKSVENLMVTVNTEIMKMEQDIGRIEHNIEIIENEKIQNQQLTSKEKEQYIETHYDKDWILNYAEFRFLKILEEKGNAQAILEDYRSQRARSESQELARFNDLKKSRDVYRAEYNTSYDIEDKNNDKYTNELNWLIDTKLPEYENQIMDSQKKAYEQFQEDFISKLKMNIDRVCEQIDELNKNLKDVPFDGDRYLFKVDPRPEYKPYYDMITDKLLMDGYNLTSELFQSKHKDIIDELFRNIIDVGEVLINNDKRTELEKNIEKFTDYRTYLKFDLKVIHGNNGEPISISKTIYTNSGGETQVPYFLCVLASFVQIYRTKQRPEYSNTIRLIIFDEAFNKMDHVRIFESIKLLRKLGLQAIICAPTEKISEISPIVDRTNLVTRIKEQTVICEFDPKELED